MGVDTHYTLRCVLSILIPPSSPSVLPGPSNKFANDGSFLQQFMKMQKEKGNNTSGKCLTDQNTVILNVSIATRTLGHINFCLCSSRIKRSLTTVQCVHIPKATHRDWLRKQLT